MIAVARLWWQQRSPREQILLGVMSGMLIGFGYVFGLWLPLERAQSAATARLAHAVAHRAVVAKQIVRLRQLPATSGAGISAEALSASAQAAGFSVSRVEAVDAASVAIEIDAARAPALFGWLKGLEAKGVFVVEARLVTRSDATLGVHLLLRGAAQ